MHPRLKPHVRWQEGTFLLGGSLVARGERAPIVSLNPATEEPLAEIPTANVADVDAAVALATEAGREWRRTDVMERGRSLLALAAALRERAEALARIGSLDNGIPIAFNRGLAGRAADRMTFYAGLGPIIKGETSPPGKNFIYTLREPYGVVAVITPWNAPLLFASGRVTPALMAGNTVILKPAEQACLSELELAAIAREFLPPGVFTVLPGDGPVTGQALVTHPAVKKISFTGSVETGVHITRVAAEKVPHLTLELGGKSPQIVFPDADLEAAVEGVFSGMALTYNAGQTCYAGTRLFLHEALYKPFIERLVARCRALRIGDPADEATQMGPLISREQRERVLGYIERGVAEGARVLTGGGRPRELAGRGFFVEPTLLAATSGMEVAQDEIFGPVLAVMRWSDEGEMIAAANSVRYGLAAGIWTRDLARAHATAARLEAGYIWINHYGVLVDGMPFGGYKQSGVGRVSDTKDVLTYTQEKTVNIRL